MTLNRLKTAIIFFSLIALCFDAYAFFYVASFPVTLSFLCVASVLVIGVFEILFNNKPINSKQLLVSAAFILLIAFNMIFSTHRKLSSAALYIFYILVFSVSGYGIGKDKFYGKLKTVMIFYTVLSVYAIYQFIAYFYDLPLKEFLIEGFMVKGFNRTNLVSIGGLTFQRAHSIYLEPSFLSQFAIFAIILSVMLYHRKRIKLKSCIAITIVNFIAAVLSVAGTGFLMLGVIVIYFCIEYVITHGLNKRVVIGLSVLVIGLLGVAFLDTSITEYIRVRLAEIFDPKYSGGMRFSYPYLIMFDTWGSNFFGYTPGNELIAISNYFNKQGISVTFPTMASGYAKIGVELGVPGLILLFVLMFSVRWKWKDAGCKYIFIFMLCINFMGGNLLQNYFWVFMILLNVKFTPKAAHKSGNFASAKGSTVPSQKKLVSD